MQFSDSSPDWSNVQILDDRFVILMLYVWCASVIFIVSSYLSEKYTFSHLALVCIYFLDLLMVFVAINDIAFI